MFHRFRICDDAPSAEVPTRKRYVHDYHSYGFELGFGREGSFPGHAHLHFQDIIYCPDGLVCTDSRGISVAGVLASIAPRTYFACVCAGSFFFVKYCPTASRVILPDKVGDVLEGMGMVVAGRDCTVVTPWFASEAADGGSRAVIELLVDGLRITFGLEHSIEVRR